jgi:hypothetical protein
MQAPSSTTFVYCGGGCNYRSVRVAPCIGGVDAEGGGLCHTGGEGQASEKALVKVSINLDAEWAKAEATQKECLSKMKAHFAHAKYSLILNKMLGDKKVELDGRERNQDLHKAADAGACPIFSS